MSLSPCHSAQVDNDMDDVWQHNIDFLLSVPAKLHLAGFEFNVGTAKLDDFNALQLVQDEICLVCAQVSPIPGGGVNCVRKRLSEIQEMYTVGGYRFFYRAWMFAWGSLTLPIHATTTTLSKQTNTTLSRCDCDGWKAHCLSTGVRSSGVCSLPACPLGITQPTIHPLTKWPFSVLSLQLF